MKLPRLRLPSRWWRITLIVIVVLAGVAALFTYQLGSLAPHLSPTELKTVASSHQLVDIAHSPLDAPFKLLVWIALHTPKLPELWQARLPSVVLGLVSMALAVYVLHHWYGRRTTMLGFLIFISSALVLHVARFASTDITYILAPLAVLATNIYLHDHEGSVAAWFIWLTSLSLLLFTPGLLWLVVLVGTWQWRAIVAAWRTLNLGQRILSIVIPLGVLGTLAQASVIGNWKLLVPLWLGLPRQLSLHTLSQLPQSMVTTLSFIGWRAPTRPEIWLGDVPLLNVFLLAMLAAGVFFYARHWQASRTRMLGSYLVLCILLVSLGRASIGLVAPLLYLIAVAGIAYVLQFWLRVFPRNPLARGFGIGLMTVLVALSCYFGVVQYFVAWPNNPAVKQVYQIKR